MTGAPLTVNDVLSRRERVVFAVRRWAGKLLVGLAAVVALGLGALILLAQAS